MNISIENYIEAVLMGWCVFFLSYLTLKFVSKIQQEASNKITLLILLLY